jgi:hypothetical protein
MISLLTISVSLEYRQERHEIARHNLVRGGDEDEIENSVCGWQESAAAEPNGPENSDGGEDEAETRELQQARADKATTVAGWSPPKTISWDAQERTYWSDIVATGDTIHIAWSGSPQRLWDIYYARSTDGGKTWRWSKESEQPPWKAKAYPSPVARTGLSWRA